MNPITWLGAVIAFLGVLGLALPAFTTSQTRDVASLGDIKTQSTEQSTHVVSSASPSWISHGASGLIFGLILVGAGVYARRDEGA